MLEWTDPDLDDLLGNCLVTGQLVQLLELHFSAAKQFIPISPSEAQMRNGLIGFCRKQDKLPSLLDEIRARNETRFKEIIETRDIEGTICTVCECLHHISNAEQLAV